MYYFHSVIDQINFFLTYLRERGGFEEEKAERQQWFKDKRRKTNINVCGNIINILFSKHA